MIPSGLLLAAAVVMGAVSFWDLGGLATKMRSRLEERPLDGGFYRRMPAWVFRAFGVWCVVFGIGQFVYVVVTVPR